MFKISPELKLLILSDEMVVIQQLNPVRITTLSGKVIEVPGNIEIEIQLNLNDKPDLFQECLVWMETIDTYFKTSYRACRLDIGPYDALYPIECRADGLVKFSVDEYYPGRTLWKDWFVQEVKHAS